MTRADELRAEADCLARAAGFLTASAERKRRLAAEMERIDGAEGRLGGGDAEPPPRLAGTHRGHGA